MNKKHQSRRLTLNRETLHRLEEESLRTPQGRGADVAIKSQDILCQSPWCVPTFGAGCETQQ